MKSGILLSTSLALNVTLVAAFAWFIFHANSELFGPVVPSSEPIVSRGPQAFRWSQVESPDYPTYIANLRTIGCPEQTVREIIAADLNDLYTARRKTLQARLDGGGTKAEERIEVEADLSHLRQEQAEIMRILFGLPLAEASAPAQRRSPLRARRSAVEDSTPVMPLVFQAIDPNQVPLTADDQSTLDQIRADFLQELGANQDVNSPEYLHRWRKAQSQADSLLDAMLGRQAGLQYRQAAEQALATASGPAATNP